MAAAARTRTVISPPKHSDASWAESKGLTSASLNRYLQGDDRLEGKASGARGSAAAAPHHLLVL